MKPNEPMTSSLFSHAHSPLVDECKDWPSSKEKTDRVAPLTEAARPPASFIISTHVANGFPMLYMDGRGAKPFIPKSYMKEKKKIPQPEWNTLSLSFKTPPSHTKTDEYDHQVIIMTDKQQGMWYWSSKVLTKKKKKANSKPRILPLKKLLAKGKGPCIKEKFTTCFLVVMVSLGGAKEESQEGGGRGRTDQGEEQNPPSMNEKWPFPSPLSCPCCQGCPLLFKSKKARPRLTLTKCFHTSLAGCQFSKDLHCN